MTIGNKTILFSTIGLVYLWFEVLPGYGPGRITGKEHHPPINVGVGDRSSRGDFARFFGGRYWPAIFWTTGGGHCIGAYGVHFYATAVFPNDSFAHAP